ncbi:conserved hypothetical protein [Ricinus communis]|uniref:Uncharacterized protein n=1 Tax=Ricinus communis TaxID=3988 RepID=B9RKR6_RICCO|nr:conserved hypothetical protein [Ricinus communis]
MSVGYCPIQRVTDGLNIHAQISSPERDIYNRWATFGRGADGGLDSTTGLPEIA